MSTYADSDDRKRVYRRLALRNRVVGALRIAVPVLGVLVLVGLVGQIYLSSLAAQFGIGSLSVTRETVTIDTPTYSGVLDDGSAYHVSATNAVAAISATDLLALSDASLRVVRPTGETIHVTADRAQLDTSRQVVTIPGNANVVESSGTNAMFSDSVYDSQTQVLTGRGPVLVDYADGTHIVAKGMQYDAKTAVWTFTGATVTLPETPGADAP